MSPRRLLFENVIAHMKRSQLARAPFSEVIAILIIHGKGRTEPAKLTVHFEWRRKLPNLSWLLAIRCI